MKMKEPENISIPTEMLMELIFWARRYCDGRATYAPSEFNKLYKNMVQFFPKLKEMDQFDHTLKDGGKYWPFAQDGMYDEKTGGFDARR